MIFPRLWHHRQTGMAVVVLVLSLACPRAWGAAPYDLVDLGAHVHIVRLDVTNGVLTAIGRLNDQAVLLRPGQPPHLLGFLPDGSFSAALGIYQEAVVGVSSTGHLGLATHAFLFTGGVLVDLGTLGEATLFSSATGLNTTTIVGSCSTPENVTVPCVWPRSGGPPQELPTLGGTTPAFLGGIVAINSQGAMVGTSQTPAGDLHATLWPADGSAPVDLTPGTGFDSQALSINEVGVIVGESQQRAFRWACSGTSCTVTDLGRFDGDQATSLRGVNEGGLSVGVSELASPSAFAPHRAIRVRGTTLEDLATLVDLPPGWALDTATAVSNSGVIAGDGFLNGEPHGWLLVPKKAAKHNERQHPD